MLKPLRDFVAFDLETTGLERDTDEIIEIGAVRVRDGVVVDKMSCLIKAAKALSPLVESLTGINKEMLEAAKEPKEGLEEFLQFAGAAPLVAHNSEFDATFMGSALAKAGLPPLSNPVYDSLLLARVAWPVMDSHRLENLVGKLGLPPQSAHRALPDAEQAALLWLKGEEKLAGYAPKTLSAIARVVSTGPTHWCEFFGGSEAALSESPTPFSADPKAAGGVTGAVSASLPIKTEGAVDALFISGKMAEAFATVGRPYHGRVRQARLATLAERAMNESRILVVESEPGTGRLLACLVPAVRRAMAHKRPVFFAVPGRKGLERVVTSELPILQALLGGEVRMAPLKPPRTYISPRKLAGILSQPQTRLSPDERLGFLPILTWLETTQEGDIAENTGFNYERNTLLWSKLSSDSYAAEPGSYAHAARERAARAHVVLISHDLFLDDLVLEFALLPTYETIFFEEAHRLPEAGQARLGREVSFFRLKHILQLIAHSKSDASGLLAELARATGEELSAPLVSTDEASVAAGDVVPKTDLEKLKQKVFEPERQLQKFFNKIAKHAQKRRKEGENRIRYADKLVIEFNAGPEAVLTSLDDLVELLTRLAETQADLAQDLRKVADLLRSFRTDLEHLAHPSGTNEVNWIEDFPNPHRALIRSAPLEIGTLLSEKFYPLMEAVIFASPAMAIGDDFKFFCAQIGLATEHQDRLKTALIRAKDPADQLDPIFITRFSPVVSNNAALQTMAQVFLRGLARFPRPSFALFTHIGMLKQARAHLQEGLAESGRVVLAQHVDGSRDNLLHLFKQRKDACLLGTDTFVESLGTDDSLPEIVLVTKLPFPVPTDPLTAPHLEKLQENGQNPLYDYILPNSILRLKQELNRLPRRPGQRLAIWIMDPRLATENYARFYQRGLGRDAVICDTEADLMAYTAALLEGGGMPTEQTMGITDSSATADATDSNLNVTSGSAEAASSEESTETAVPETPLG